MLAYRDLQEFAAYLENRGLLKRITSEVDPELEITEITDRVSKKYGPALLFENVKGSQFPLIINTFGTYERMSMSLGVEKLDDIAEDVSAMVDIFSAKKLMDKLKSIPMLTQLAGFPPKKVKKAPCQEVVAEPDLGKLPILKCWPLDGGKFITLPLVFTKDPETGERNCGMYRLQVFDEKTTGMHWHMHKDGASNFCKHKMRGERMEVAVALGGDPATIYASTAPLPKNLYELVFAGFLRKAAVEEVKCKTVDLYVPAHAEFILEGYVDPQEETRIEGPFGDHTGYYSLADQYPVFHLTCITHKKNAIYPATIVGKPPMEDCYLAKATERIFLPLLKMIIPEVLDINLPLEGVFHSCAIVSIKKTFPGQARKVINALWGLGQMMFTKMIIVVDEKVDPQDLSTVMWKVFNNVDPKRDLMIVDGPLDALDHSSPLPNFGGKMGIDATVKGPSEGHLREWPEDIEMAQSIRELVNRKWEEYGLE